MSALAASEYRAALRAVAEYMVDADASAAGARPAHEWARGYLGRIECAWHDADIRDLLADVTGLDADDHEEAIGYVRAAYATAAEAEAERSARAAAEDDA